MAKEIIDAVKEAELGGRYNVDNAKNEAENMVRAEEERLRTRHDRRVGEARAEAEARLARAREEASHMLSDAEEEAGRLRNQLWEGNSEKKHRAFEELCRLLFD